nr:two-component regulator propeller domain-containing protein [uncultured Draconibacterium sp.]
MSCLPQKIIDNNSVEFFAIIFFVFCFTVHTSLAQDTKLNFQSIEDELSNPTVKCIFKDSKGFVWIGTNEGLNRFDGSNIILYEKKIGDRNSLTSNGINTIIEDQNQKLWVGTGSGLCLYDRKNDNFRAFHKIDERLLLSVSSLAEDINHNIWIGTSGVGLYKYNEATDSLYSYMPDHNTTHSISSNFINCILSDKKGRVWLGTRAGLDLYDSARNVFLHFNDKLESLAGPIKALCLDEEGDVWVGTYGKGLFEIAERNENWQFRHFQSEGAQNKLSNNDVLSLMCDDSGNIWVGTENGGLNVLNQKTETIAHYVTDEGDQRSISGNSIWSLYQDKTGIIWIGTYNHGLNIIDDQIEKFEVYQKNIFKPNTLQNNNVTNFSEDADGNILIATDGGGISCFNTKTRCFTEKINNSDLSSKAAIAVLCDSKQRIWVGTWGGGLDVFNSSGKKIKNYSLETYNRPGNVLSLLEDKEGNIWVGSAEKGLFLYNSLSDELVAASCDSLDFPLSQRSYINVMFQDSEGTYWLGLPNGLISMECLNGERYFNAYVHENNDPNSISSSSITAIFEDSGNNLWIGTSDGLNLFDKKSGKFIIYRKENGLPNNSINGILEDENGYLWISTLGGISKFNSKRKTFKNYTKEDGLPSKSFNIRSTLKTQSGEFFFGSNKGFVAFFPDSIKANTYIPPMCFTGFKIFNNPVVIGAKDSPLSKNISETSELTLTHKQTSFTIEFVALNYTHSRKNQYAYKLEGFDTDWDFVGNKQYANYTNINAGNYIFKVRGSNNEGLWNSEPLQLRIKVLPPIWKTKVAYILYLLFIIAILWVFIRLLIIKSSQAEKLRLEKIHHEKSEELNRMKLQFFANISHEFRTPLSLILAPLKQSLEEGLLQDDVKRRLSMVLRNANKMYRLVNELMDFTKSEEGRLKMMVQETDIISFSHEVYSLFEEEAKQRAITYKFESETGQLNVWFDKNKMEKIISNLLSNAFKFTQNEGQIVLKIESLEENGQLSVVLSVSDNGIGISEKYIDKVFDRFFQSPDRDNKQVTGTGIGLALVKSLVELHDGTINVRSKKNEGTCFEIKLRLGKVHFKESDIFDESSLDHSISNEVPLLKKDNETAEIKGKNAPLLLIVEDNKELCDYLGSVLEIQYNILKAPDGEEGLKLAKEFIPDLILSDVTMPRLSGTELCKAVKTEMSTSHIPVILLTSRTATSEVIEGVETGADNYISKPFDVMHLKVAIEKTIENRRKLYQRFSQDVYLIPNKNAENELDQKFLISIIEYIDKNVLDKNITVENLAAHLLMSRTNVYRKIKAITGQTATEFIRNTRLKMAIKLLEEGKYNISEISFKVGFSSPGYFAKCFKDHYGKSPSEFVSPQNRTN